MRQIGRKNCKAHQRVSSNNAPRCTRFDKEQAKKTGTGEAVRALVEAGVPVKAPRGRLYTFDKAESRYVEVDEAREGEEYVNRGHIHYKHMILDVEFPDTETDGQLQWSTEGPCGVVQGSFNPTKFSIAGGSDSSTYIRRKSVVQTFAENFTVAWERADWYTPDASL